MNSSSFIESSVLVQNSTMTILESWFMPLDIFKILCCILMTISSTFFLLILIFDKTCHTVPMMLVANSYLSLAIYGCNMLGTDIFAFQNDLKQIEYQDSLCVLRAYILYSVGATFYYSYLIQALHRYLIVIYPTRLLFQSFRFQISIICSSWLVCFVYPFGCLLSGQIIYSVDGQLCEIPLALSFSPIYILYSLYINPTLLTRYIYWKLTRHVKQMGKNVGTANTLSRAQRELKMVRRIVILTTILVIICFPYSLFTFMAFFNDAPKYHGRITLACATTGGLVTVFVLFQFTDPLKEAVMKRIKLGPNRIIAAMA